MSLFDQDLARHLKDPEFAREFHAAKDRTERIQRLYRRLVIKAGLEGKAFSVQKILKKEKRRLEQLMRLATRVIDKEIQDKESLNVPATEPEG